MGTKSEKMSLKLELDYSDLLKLIKQLPTNQILQLKSDLDNQIKGKKMEESANTLQELLLEGPVMTDEEYENFQENRKLFDRWREN